MSNNTIFFMRNPNACFTQVQPDEIIILNPSDNSFYHLNASACDLWLALEKPVTSQDLITKLTQKYDTTNNTHTYNKDIIEWTTDMEKKGLVTSSSSADTLPLS